MYSTNVPVDTPHLQDTWSPDGVHGGHPAFRSDEHGMWLRYDEDRWCINQDFVPLAYAVSDAVHPTTIHPGEWCILVYLPRGWRVDPAFGFGLPTSHSSPRSDGAIDLHDVGLDIFMHGRPPPFWYVDPGTGERQFSGTCAGGKRFCSSCFKSYPSKLFVTHLRTVHEVALPSRRLT